MDRRYIIASVIGIVLIALLMFARPMIVTNKTTYAVEIRSYVDGSEAVDSTLGTLTLSYIPADASESDVMIKTYSFSPIITDTITIPSDAYWFLIRCDLTNGYEPNIRDTLRWNSIIYNYANSTFYIDVRRSSQQEINLELYFSST